MNFLQQKTKLLLYGLILLFTILIHKCENQFVLSSVNMQSPQQTFTIPYNKTLPNGNYKLAYFIQSGTILKPQFRLTHDSNATTITSTQCTIKLILQGVSSMLATQNLIVQILISSYSRELITVQMTSTTANTPVYIPLPVYYDPTALIKSLQPKVFALNIPMSFTQTLINSTHLKILPTKTPTVITTISFSYIILTRTFLSNNVGIFIDQITVNHLDWIILINNDTFLDPNQNTMLVGLTSYVSTANNVINNQAYIDYNFPNLLSDARSIYVNYDVDSGSPTKLDANIFLISQVFTGCPAGQFLVYTDLYYDSPVNCQACHASCKTCTNVDYSLSLSDQTSCLSCSSYKSFQKNNSNSITGKCTCYPGLEVNPITYQCTPCKTNCLGYTVNFMKSSTKSEFILMFSNKINALIPLQNNLQVFISQNTVSSSFKLQLKKQGLYYIYVDLKDLKACNVSCSINFTFQYPHKILKAGKNQALGQYQEIVNVQGFYDAGDLMPQQVDQAFAISGMMAGAAAGGGLSSLLKMLFQLQQMIEYHKYLNLQLPLIFKQFIQSLSMFKFMDLTTIFPYDVQSILQDLGPDDFDMQGPIKSIYYQNGSNFYKNIIPILVSFGIVLSINFILFLLLRLIPCQLSWRFSQKLRIRALITFCDMLQTMILPIVVFAQFQIFTVYFKVELMWVYAIMGFLLFAVLFLPFFIMTYVYINKRSKIMKQVYEDLLNDCQNQYSATYIFFIISYYRKIFFAFSLTYLIPGKIQGSLILSINAIYLSMIVYIIAKRLFNSKIKILTKTINVISVIGIQTIMLYYNFQKLSIDKMLQLGIACRYLAIIATVASVIEAFIKILQIIFQNIYYEKNKKDKEGKYLNNQIQQIAKELGMQKQIMSPKYAKNNSKQQGLILVPINSKQSIDTQQLNTRQYKRRNNKKNKLIDHKQSLFQKFNQSTQNMINANQLVSLDSNDDIGISLTNKNQNSNKKGLGNKNQYGKFKNKVKKFNTLQVINSDVLRKPSFVEEQQLFEIPQVKPKQYKNVDDEISQVQNRIRQKLNIKKKLSMQNQLIRKREFDTIDVDRQYPIPSSNKKLVPARQNKQRNSQQPVTQRVRYSQNDDKLIQNINQKKTARRRKKDNPNSLNSSIKKNPKDRKQDKDQDPDDIYYIP